MLYVGLVFLTLALVTAYLGFFAIVGPAALAAQVLFIASVVLMIVSFVAKGTRSRM